MKKIKLIALALVVLLVGYNCKEAKKEVQDKVTEEVKEEDNV